LELEVLETVAVLVDLLFDLGDLRHVNAHGSAARDQLARSSIIEPDLAAEREKPIADADGGRGDAKSDAEGRPPPGGSVASASPKATKTPATVVQKATARL
jgi:hypothetical protein